MRDITELLRGRMGKNRSQRLRLFRGVGRAQIPIGSALPRRSLGTSLVRLNNGLRGFRHSKKTSE